MKCGGAPRSLFISRVCLKVPIWHTREKFTMFFFSDISSMSEASVFIYSEKTPIENLVFNNVTITVAKFGNVSHPCHDFRPNPGNNLPYAPTDGWYVDNVDGIVYNHCTIKWGSPVQPYWGICKNVSRVTRETEVDFKCVGN